MGQVACARREIGSEMGRGMEVLAQEIRKFGRTSWSGSSLQSTLQPCWNSRRSWLILPGETSNCRLRSLVLSFWIMTLNEAAFPRSQRLQPCWKIDAKGDLIRHGGYVVFLEAFLEGVLLLLPMRTATEVVMGIAC